MSKVLPLPLLPLCEIMAIPVFFLPTSSFKGASWAQHPLCWAVANIGFAPRPSKVTSIGRCLALEKSQWCLFSDWRRLAAAPVSMSLNGVIFESNQTAHVLEMRGHVRRHEANLRLMPFLCAICSSQDQLTSSRSSWTKLPKILTFQSLSSEYWEHIVKRFCCFWFENIWKYWPGRLRSHDNVCKQIVCGL